MHRLNNRIPIVAYNFFVFYSNECQMNKRLIYGIEIVGFFIILQIWMSHMTIVNRYQLIEKKVSAN